jgi:phage/conjugal plasmid C-4 type zinc finger TraR family protein
MAGGWSRDGAVQEQIDASTQQSIERARSQLPTGASLECCAECDTPIPEARRKAVPGVRLCVECQAELDKDNQTTAAFNRRGSKDSQLR